jgi:hypothetical protein
MPSGDVPTMTKVAIKPMTMLATASPVALLRPSMGGSGRLC